MDTQPTNLETEIISAITNIPNDIPRGKGDGVWTAAIKRSLIPIGRKRGYNVCTSGFHEECDNEWLFDMTWYRNDPPNHLRELGLVLESEWNRDPAQIKYDFEKLLIAKSPIKVMVFQDYDDNLPFLWSLLETGIRSFQTTPTCEKYILAAFENAKYTFAIRIVTV
ncbi:MAG: hypothetical protein M0Z50_11485 [Planctomycetia bacterium]|nr:hypothetical protein [Planctomycetia bacterium]